MTKRRIGLQSLLVISVASPAFGQAWIGEFAARLASEQRQAREESMCMSGRAPETSALEAAFLSSSASMRLYWTTLERRPSAAIGAQFHKGKNSRWADGLTIIPMLPGTVVTDPFVSQGAGRSFHLNRFILAGDETTARGHWRVLDGAGQVIGIYDGIFKRSQGEWRLWQLRLLPAQNGQERLVQYCHQLGDVEVHKVKMAEMRLADALKWEARMAKRAAQAKIESDKAAAAYAKSGKGNPKSTPGQKAALAAQKMEDANSSLRYAKLSVARAEVGLTELQTDTIVAAFDRALDRRL